MTDLAIQSSLSLVDNIMPLLVVYNCTFLAIRIILNAAFRGKL